MLRLCLISISSHIWSDSSLTRGCVCDPLRPTKPRTSPRSCHFRRKCHPSHLLYADFPVTQPAIWNHSLRRDVEVRVFVRTRTLMGRLLAVKWRRVVAWRTRRIRRRRWWRQIIYVVICVVIHRQRSSPYQKEQTRNSRHPPYGADDACEFESAAIALRALEWYSADVNKVGRTCKGNGLCPYPPAPLHFALCPPTVSSKALIVHACGEFPADDDDDDTRHRLASTAG